MSAAVTDLRSAWTTVSKDGSPGGKLHAVDSRRPATALCGRAHAGIFAPPTRFGLAVHWNRADLRVICADCRKIAETI